MAATPLSHRSIIELLGDNAVLAEVVGLSSGAITRWKYRGIPALYWPKLERLARKQGVALTVEDLEAASPRGRRCAA